MFCMYVALTHTLTHTHTHTGYLNPVRFLLCDTIWLQLDDEFHAK